MRGYMDFYDLYGSLRTGFIFYQDLDFHQATLVLRYKGLSCFSGYMVLMVSETLELLNVSNNRSSYSLAIVHVKL